MSTSSEAAPAKPFPVGDIPVSNSTSSSSSSQQLAPYQVDYLSISLASGILSFDGAPYTLKSGRKSPYFFNAGLFNSGSKIDAVASCYASAIVRSGVQFDVLFGPAYKVSPDGRTDARSGLVQMRVPVDTEWISS